MRADELLYGKKSVTNILVQDAGMRKLAAKLMSLNLKQEQKNKHLTLYTRFAEQLQEDTFLDYVIIGHETLFMSMILRPNASPWSGDRRIPSS
jgi:hypothetical protein